MGSEAQAGKEENFRGNFIEFTKVVCLLIKFIEHSHRNFIYILNISNNKHINTFEF